MTAAGTSREFELVVAEDGSIPAGQIAALGVRPGAHLRVVADREEPSGGSIRGRLTDWPDVSWQDFEAASELARADVSES